MDSIPDQHIDESMIEQYLMSTLPSAAVQEVEEHLLMCNFCIDVAEELEAVVAAIQLAYRQPDVQRFVTHLPLYDLQAAAGQFGKQQITVEPEGWVEARQSQLPLTTDMFVVHVKGFSMEPLIRSGNLCAFKANVVGPYEGKLLLMEEYGQAGGNRHTVKLYHKSKNADPCKEGDDEWLHERITLESINPEFESWDVASSEKVNVIGEFLFVVRNSWSTHLLV